MTTRTLLDAVRPDAVTPRPFPYVTQAATLDDELCRHLAAEFPASETIANGKPLNGASDRFTLQTAVALTSADVSRRWKAFIAAHVTRAFYHQVLDVFEPFIRQEYPRFEHDVGPLRALRVGTRGIDSFDDADVLIDANLCINTPDPLVAPVPRIAHVDQPTKLFVGLWYLKPDEDRSTGGDLEFYAYTDEATVRLCNRRLPIDAGVTLSGRVPYERNRSAFFVNTFRAVHARRPRSSAACPRRFVNIIGWIRTPLFQVS